MVLDINAIEVECPVLDKSLLTTWISSVAQRFNKRVGNLTYIFVNDENILKVNREFLQHDYYTDIITFDYSKRGMIAGDMYISLDTVLSNSHLLEVPYQKELMRVIIHGVLHLCGLNDKGPGEREIMEKHENESLALFQSLLGN